MQSFVVAPEIGDWTLGDNGDGDAIICVAVSPPAGVVQFIYQTSLDNTFATGVTTGTGPWEDCQETGSVYSPSDVVYARIQWADGSGNPISDWGDVKNVTMA